MTVSPNSESDQNHLAYMLDKVRAERDRAEAESLKYRAALTEILEFACAVRRSKDGKAFQEIAAEALGKTWSSMWGSE